MNRDLWIDALKAFLALGVLYSHTLLHYPLESVAAHWQIEYFIHPFKVPGFYFISGFLLYSAIKRISTFADVKALITKKFRQILVPSILFTLVPSFTFGIVLLTHLNTGHYFLASLFCLIVLYSILAYGIRSLSRGKQIFILAVYSIITTALLTLFHDVPIYSYFHWKQALHGNLFFISGVIAGMCPDVIESKLRSVKVLFSLGVLYVFSYILLIHSPWSISTAVYKLIYRIVAPLLGIGFVFIGFSYLSKYIHRNSRIGKAAYYLSLRTLPLYVIQGLVFMLVFGVFDTNSVGHPMLLATLTFILTGVLTLVAHDLFCAVPYVNRVVFGRKKKIYSFKDLIEDCRTISRKNYKANPAREQADL